MNAEFLVKAEENLKAAELLFGAGLFNASANRAYYSAYHLAITALAHGGIQDARQHNSHRWVLVEFSKVVGRKRFPSWTKDALYRLREVRDEADYAPQGIDKMRAKRQLDKAKEFFDVIATQIR